MILKISLNSQKKSCAGVFFSKIADWKWKKTDGRSLRPVLIKFEVIVFFCKFCQILKKNSFTELLPATTFGVKNLSRNVLLPLWSVSKCPVKMLQKHRRCSVKKVFLKVSQISQKILVLQSLFNKVAGLQCNYIKRRIQHRCFPVNNVKFLRTSILKNICIKLFLLFCKNRNVRPKFSSFDALFEEEFTIPWEKIEATVRRCSIKKAILKKLWKTN